jgi:hypothetical protein
MVSAGFLAAGVAGWPAAALALSLDEAKAAGLVGEQPDGYLGVVAGAQPDVASMVERINSERRAHYVEIAKRNGTSVSAVEALAGKKTIERTPSGEYVMVPGRGWVRKP